MPHPHPNAAQGAVEFAASHREAPSQRRIGPVPEDETIRFSLYFKPKSNDPGTRAEHQARRAQEHEEGFALVRDFAKAHGLRITAESPARRRVALEGAAKDVCAALNISLHHYEGEHGTRFRGREGCLHLPPALADITEAVLGIDNRPAARPKIVFRPAEATASASFNPNQVGQLYGQTPGLTGAGETIGLIELGGGYLESDITTAFASMGLTPPQVTAVSVDGGSNSPTPDDGADGEVALDIQVAGGIAPGAKIAVYFATNTDAGFVDAITQATQDETNAPSILSISWGSAESSWTAQAMTSMTSALQDAANVGLSVFVAAGDNLATDGVSDGQAHVDFPASSPWAIGCGGTKIAAASGRLSQEVVWNEGASGTGGGISAVYPVPNFQSAITLPANVNGGGTGRGVPDVAGNADPNSGYNIVVSGQTEVVGGTSAVAPLWAGITALANQQANAKAGFFLPRLYTANAGTNDITSGNNKPTGSQTGYNATKGWDACTGLGSPQIATLVTLLGTSG